MSVVVVRGLSCEWLLVFGSGSVEVKVQSADMKNKKSNKTSWVTLEPFEASMVRSLVTGYNILVHWTIKLIII